MAIIRRRHTFDPVREIEDMAQRFNHLLSEWPKIGGDGEQLQLTEWSPTVNVSETDAGYHIDAELPGVKKDDVHVSFDNGVLTIRGQRREEKEEKGQRFHRKESSFGSFMRRFSMPEDADETGIDASFEDGMLKIDIPRTEKKKAEKREIQIK